MEKLWRYQEWYSIGLHSGTAQAPMIRLG